MPSLASRIGIYLVILLVALFLFAQYVRRTSMFFPEKYPMGRWDANAYAVTPSDEWLTTSDGVRLHGWLFRATSPAAPMIVWFHGNGGNLTDRAPVATEFARRGVSAFVFDWRGFGRSGGAPSEDALYRDAIAAYDFVATKLQVPSEQIVLYGESVGGPYAAYIASKHRAHCVVIENSFPSLSAIGNTLYRPLPLGWFAPRAMRTTRWLNDARLPVLVMHGRHDAVIPFALGQELFDGLHVPKRMFVSEHASHGEIPSMEGNRYYDAVTAFIHDPRP